MKIHRLNKKITVAVIFLAIFSSTIMCFNVKAVGPFDITSSIIYKGIDESRVQLAPGITKKVYTFIDSDKKRQKMFVIEADNKNSNVLIKTGMPYDRGKYAMQTVSDQARYAINGGKNVIAAVNGDFYYMVTGEPIGIIYRDGKPIKSSFETGWKFFGILKNGTAVIGDKSSYMNVKDDLVEALGGNAMLVYEGQIYDTPITGRYREPRTAVGIRKDGTVFFVTVDGKDESYSAGLSIKDLAKLMKDMGAIRALNLDGGGSSAFISKNIDNDSLYLQNRPSDGRERKVGSSWLVTTSAISNKLFKFANIKPLDKVVTPHSIVNFKAIGKDEAGMNAELPYEGVVWDISDKSYGTIDQNGVFKSNGKVGQVEILVYYDGKIVGRTWLEIANPSKIYINKKNIRVDKKGTINVKVIAKYKDRPIDLKDDAIEFMVTNGIGNIDSKGNFHAKDKSCYGKIIAKVKGTSISTSVDVVVGNLEELNKIVIQNKTRISGNNRFATAVSIANKLYDGQVDNVVIANAYNYTDQISASILAKNIEAPVLLFGNNEEYDKEALGYIKEHLSEDGKIYIIGGNGAINYKSINSIKMIGYENIERIDGKDRYETNIKINSQVEVQKGTPLIIASGEGFADALSIATIAHLKKYPLILTSKGNLSPYAVDYINEIKPSKIYIAGGQGVVGKNIEKEVLALTSLKSDNIIRFNGENRYDTNLNILKYFNIEGDTIAIASGVNFPDSLVGSLYASFNNATILLVNNNMNLMKQKRYVEDKAYKNCIIFGGTGVVSNKTVM